MRCPPAGKMAESCGCPHDQNSVVTRVASLKTKMTGWKIHQFDNRKLSELSAVTHGPHVALCIACIDVLPTYSGLSEEVKKEAAVICHGSGASEIQFLWSWGDEKGQKPIPHF